MKKISLLFLLFVSTLSLFSQNKADKIIGTYNVIEPNTKEVSKVRIYKTTAGTYAGKVVWLKNPNFKNGKPKTDVYNPDPALRNTLANQIILMRGFTYDSKNNEWSGGTIYNPGNGKTYKCYMRFESDSKLKVRGYIGVSLFGETMYWYKE